MTDPSGSSSVDNKVVAMTFDNAKFERKIAETMTSLDRLKQSLDFSASRRGVEDLSVAANKLHLGALDSSLQHVSARFLAMTTIAVTALANITTAALHTGANLLRSLSIAPVLDGFREYETNINSIQTILSNTKSKGTTLDDVTKALDILNTYSDQTIYNFSEMTRNIGTFTAAGIDLDTSVNAIKGIANLAAISGSNSQQASTAMYQLSQALASGTVKLIDWNSVVNAGMGGEVFQTALFETGKALGTIANVPLGQTFTEWKDAGNTFRNSLESGWLTADVLTTTLSAFTGDLNEAQLMALGYTQAQAAEMIELGKTGKAAATEVKTLTQLLGTVKEAIGSGWSQSFRIIFGDFEEAKTLFTNISNAVGEMVSKSATGRNEVLQGWKDLGGRSSLIQGLTNAFRALFSWLGPIRRAFQHLFPPATAETLFNLTERFRLFMARLTLSAGTGIKLRKIFEGVFSAFKIGWEILKNFARVVKNLFSSFADQNGSKILDFLVDLTSYIRDLRKILVDDGGITRFFDKLEQAIRHPVAFVKELRDRIVAFFSGEGIDVGFLDDSFGRLSDRFESLRTIAQKLSDAWSWVKDAFAPVVSALETVYTAVKDWFADLGTKLSEGMESGDFQPVFDSLNTLLLGGIVGILASFFKNGLTFGFDEGIVESITGALNGVTGTLNTMQTEIKADTLLKIAGAIALLTGSVLVLSLIDSKKLTKALVAMTIGFGQLFGSMRLLSGMDTNITSGAALGILAGGMILLAGAMVVLTGAMALLSLLDWESLAKGLTGLTVMLGEMVAAALLLRPVGGQFIFAGIGLGIVAAALLLLSASVAAFSSFGWEELAKGFAAIAAGLLIMTVALNQLPSASLIPMGVGLMAVSTSLMLLAGAVKLFTLFDWGELLKGFTAIGAGLLILAAALNLMPSVSLIPMGVGLLFVAGALNLIALAMEQFAGDSWGEIAKELISLAGALTILAVALNGMTGTLLGASALVVAAGGLWVLTQVIKQLAGIDTGDIAKGILAMASVLSVIAIAGAAIAPIAAPLMAFGAALLFIGAGFALFGVSALLFAKAMELIARVGIKAVDVIIKGISAFLKALPGFARDIAIGVASFIQAFLEALPPILAALSMILVQLLETLKTNLPLIQETITLLILALLQVIIDTAPKWVEAGMTLLVSFLEGIRDNIGEITAIAIDIIDNFLKALTEGLPTIVGDVVDLFVTFLTSVAYELGNVSVTLLWDIGVAFLNGFKDGLDAAAPGLWDWFTALPGKILGWIGDVAKWLWDKGIDLLKGFLGGIGRKVLDIITWLHDLPGKILGWLGDVGSWLFDVGKNLIQGFWDGIKAIWEDVKKWFDDTFGGIIDTISSILEIFSPSRVMRRLGEYTIEGFHIGLEKTWEKVDRWLNALDPAASIENGMGSRMTGIVAAINRGLSDIQNYQPTITPVLDLDQVKLGAQQLNRLLDGSTITPMVSVEQAQTLSAETLRAAADAESVRTETEPRMDVRFEQNNYSPEPLNQAAIYRRTRSQIAMAKKELVTL